MQFSVPKKVRSARTTFRRYYQLIAEARLHHTLFMIFLLTVIGGFSVWLIEGSETFDTPFDAFWWAIVTMTTVGYGDITPNLIPGKLAASIVILTGMAIVSLFTARISSVFVATKLREDQGLQEIYYQNHLIIAGWHSGAEKLVDSLKALSSDNLELVLVNTLEPSDVEGLLERYSALNPKFVRGDFSNDTIMQRAGVRDAWGVILLPEMNTVATASQVDQKTILTALSIKDINKMVKVFAYALESESVPHMRRGGVDQVVVRDSHAGYLLACHALAPGIPEVMEELLTFDSGNRIERINIPNQFSGKTVAELEQWIRDKHSAILIGIVNEEQILEISDLLSDDYSSIDAFIKRKFESAGRNTDELSHKQIAINPDPDRILKTNDAAIIIKRVS